METGNPSAEPAGLISLLKKAFSGYNEDDQQANIPLEIGADTYGGLSPEKDNMAKVDSADTIQLRNEPTTRAAQYDCFQRMASDPVLSTALDIHTAHALSSHSETGLIFDLAPTSTGNESLVAELRRDLFPKIQPHLMSWARVAAVYGVNYVRPYGREGEGIFHFEHNFYTLPAHIREYERAGELAGFTSEHMQHEKQGYAIKLAQPWSFVGIKIPHWMPDINIEPTMTSASKYSLFDGDLMARTPIETQNYGTSFLANSYAPWLDLQEALLSLRASRRNASRIDRIIGVNLDNLDPYAASDYMNMVNSQLQAEADNMKKNQQKRGLLATVHNSIIPILGNSGSLNFDTQVGDANIQHIEDVLFHLKRLSSAVAIDPSLLGWSDLMAGGLGEGGWFRTAIQATIRADWLRRASAVFIDRCIDIHLAYKYGKTLVGNDRPYRIEFNSMNTAIEAEESENRAMRVDFATSVMGLLDVFSQSRVGKSKATANYLLSDLLKMPKAEADPLVNDLVGAISQDEKMLESVNTNNEAEIRRIMISILEEANADGEES